MKIKFIPVIFSIILLFTSSVWGASLTLSWNDNSDNEDGFNIERTKEAGTFIPLKTTAANIVVYKDDTVTVGINYCYRVNAFNAAGNSTWSNTACRTPIDLPEAPDNAIVIQVETKTTIIITPSSLPR